MYSPGYYVLLGIIGILFVFSFGLMAMLTLNSRRKKAADEAAKQEPKEETLADQIQKQFAEDDKRKERIIYNKSGISKTTMKETRSAFTFANDDEETGISLDSAAADNDKDLPFK